MCLFSLHDGHDWGDDFALYLSESKTIITAGSFDKLFNDNKFIVDHSQVILGPYLYPIGFPLLISPIYKLFGLNFIALKIYLIIFFIGSIAMFFLLAKKAFPKDSFLILLTVGIISINYNYLFFLDNIASDVPFMFFSFLCLYLMYKAPEKKLIQNIITSFLIFFTCLIRDVGIVLIFVFLIFQIMRLRQISILNFALPFVIMASLYFITISLLPDGNKNLFQYAKNISANSILNNLLYYFWLLGQLIMPESSIVPHAVVFILSAVFLSFICISFFYLLKREEHFQYLAFFTAGILLIYFAWPFKQGFRFLFPLIPVLFFLLLKGVLIFFQYFGKIRIGLTVTIVLFLLNALWGINQFISDVNHSTNKSYTEEMKKIYSFIKSHIEENKTIAFFKPRALYFYTERLSMNLKDPLASNSNVDYALIYKEQFKPSDRYQILMKSEHFLLISVSK